MAWWDDPWREHFGETFGNGTVDPGGTNPVPGGYKRPGNGVGSRIKEGADELIDDIVYSGFGDLVYQILGGDIVKEDDPVYQLTQEPVEEERGIDAMTRAAPDVEPPPPPLRKRLGNKLQEFVSNTDVPAWYDDDRTMQAGAADRGGQVPPEIARRRLMP